MHYRPCNLRPAESLVVLSRFIRFVVVCLLAVLGLLATAAAAAADPTVTVVGAAAVPTSAPGTDQVTYTISVGNGPIEQVVMHARQPDSVVAAPSSVVVDGSPAPAGTVDQAGAGLTIRLGTGAYATHGGTLATGNHTVTFDVAFDTLPTGQDSANAVVDYTVNGQTRHASSSPIALALPDLRLSLPFSGERETLPLGTGDDGDFEVILRNAGGGTPAATLTITLPAGLTVDNRAGVFRDDSYQNENDFGGDQLDCSAVTPTVVHCALGAVAAGVDTLLDIPVQATPAAKVGTTGTFTVSALSDDGLDQNPSDNSVHGTVLFAGTAHLVVTVTPTHSTVTVGKSAVLTAQVRNDGPNPALDALGAVILENGHFTITGFTGHRVDLPGLLTANPSASSKPVLLAPVRRAFHRATFHRHATGAGASSALLARGTSFVLWDAGTIAPGKSVSATITVKALSFGKDRLAVLARSAAGDGACTVPNPSSQCDNLKIVNLRAVRAVTAPNGPTTGRTGPVLAETGPSAQTAPLILGGTLAIALGSALLLLTRRRPAR